MSEKHPKLKCIQLGLRYAYVVFVPNTLTNVGVRCFMQRFNYFLDMFKQFQANKCFFFVFYTKFIRSIIRCSVTAPLRQLSSLYTTERPFQGVKYKIKCIHCIRERILNEHKHAVATI